MLGRTATNGGARTIHSSAGGPLQNGNPKSWTVIWAGQAGYWYFLISQACPLRRLLRPQMVLPCAAERTPLKRDRAIGGGKGQEHEAIDCDFVRTPLGLVSSPLWLSGSSSRRGNHEMRRSWG